jgi:hypothetical protein
MMALNPRVRAGVHEADCRVIDDAIAAFTCAVAKGVVFGYVLAAGPLGNDGSPDEIIVGPKRSLHGCLADQAINPLITGR